MINKEELKQQVTETFDGFIALVASFGDEEINKIPFEGSWTPGQVADHMINGTSGIPRLVHAQVEATSRAADEKVQAIKDVFLDFSLKMKAPILRYRHRHRR